MSEALVNARVLIDGGWRTNLAVLVDDGYTRGLIDVGSVPPDAHCHDLAGRMLLPGFIDCQVNGGGGVLFNADPTVAGIQAIGAAHRRTGTTCFMPTLVSDTAEAMRAAVAATNLAIKVEVPGVLGIHFEGPFISTARRGAHDARYAREPENTEIDAVEGLKGGVTLLTLAPECVPPQTIRSLTDAGVIVSIGHSNADYETAQRALSAGARGFTHLYNAMSPLTSRAPGVVGAALDNPAAWCGVIVDGHHVAPASIRVALKAKPRGKVFLVTDAMPPVGAPEASFVLGGETITAVDGICRTSDGTLAGSALSMIEAVRNTVDLLGVDLDEAVRMASAYPAEFLGVAATHGYIREGQKANFTVVDHDLRVTETWVNGRRNN